MDDTDLARRLDRSIGPAPDSEQPLADLLAAGHQVVRRRRITAGAGTALAAAAVFVVVAISTSGSPQRAEAPIAEQPTATPSPSQAVEPTPSATPAEPSRREISRVVRDNLVHYDGQCRLTVDRGTVVRQLDDPYGLAATGGTSSVGELQVGTGLYWYASTCDAEGNESGAWIYSGDARGDFEKWVENNTPTPDSAGGDTGGPFIGIPDLDLVRFDGDTTTLLAEAGVTIVDQRAGVDVGEAFAGPGDRTAAAQVTDPGGATYFVLARSIGGEGAQPQYIAVPQAEVDGGDLDDFLDLARQRYAEGEGGLL